MVDKRLTIQKIKILEYLHSVHSHPTADVVYEAVKKHIPNISLATVYRNLNQMVDSGDVLRLEINGEYHFDGDVSKHLHCYCSRCGKLVDVFNKKITDYAIKNVDLPGFEVSNVQVLFKGLCTKCS
ncbi:transcriptional repressor [Candidatus Woesearchaeota archaeon]|nr:transcriptional repressor [Candidatus Woesearchaeota archaeon]